MKIGVSAFAWTSRFEESHLRLLPLLKDMGFDGVEIPMFSPEALPVRAIGDAFKTNGLECTVCCILPQAINPISPDAAIRHESIHHLTACVEACAAMGSKLLAGPIYAPIGYLPEHRPTENEWRWAVEVFQSIEKVLNETGVTVAIEPVNRSETFFLRTARESRILCEAIGNRRIGVNIDTFHANIEEQNIPVAILELGSHLKHIHVSENDRGLLGLGHVPFAEIIDALKTSKYNGYLMIEGFGYDPDEEIAPGKLWADVKVSPERLAEEGLAFLRSLVCKDAL
jgi:D-psicose/D-tagatose/L-ribulose 3-epimerase